MGACLVESCDDVIEHRVARDEGGEHPRVVVLLDYRAVIVALGDDVVELEGLHGLRETPRRLLAGGVERRGIHAVEEVVDVPERGVARAPAARREPGGVEGIL